MAEITDTLKLDIDQALRDVARVEAALDRALAPVELRVDDSSIRRVEDSLERVESAARETTGQVRLTAEEYREVARAVELGVDPARAIATATGEVREQANLAEADFRDVAQALDISEDQARDLAREILDAQQAANRLEDAARDVARQLDLSEDEADQLARALTRADREAGQVNVRGAALVGTFGSLRGVVAGVAGVLATVGIGQGIAVAARAAGTALGQFQALNESINAVKVTFDEGSAAIFEFGQTSAQSAGLSAQAFQQAVVPIGGVLRNFGFDAREAADASIILVQRAADLASVYNVDVSEALLSINSALVGQVEPLRRFGAEISVARVEAFLLASGMVASRDEIDQTALVQGRLALILQDTNRAAGDFANTSGQLANAQRTAQAEAENFAAAVGEELAPAMAALVSLVPDLIDALQLLIPGFAAGADSAAGFFAEIEKSGDLRTIISGVTGALSTLLDVSMSGFTVLQGVGAILTGDIGGAAEQFDQLVTTSERALIRLNRFALARSLDEGAEATSAFASSIRGLGEVTDDISVFNREFRGLAGAAGLTTKELFAVTKQLIANRAAFNFSAAEVAALELQFAILRNTLFPVGNEVAQAARAFAELGNTGSAIQPTISALQEVVAAASEVGLSMGDLAAGADPAAAALLASLDPADQFALKLEAVRTGAITAGDAFNTALTPALIDVAEGLVDLNEDGKVSLDEFTRNLQTAAQDFLDFQVNLAAIAQISPELAEALGALPDEVQRALLAEGFAKADPAAILAAAEGLTGSEAQLSSAILRIYVGAVGTLHGDDPAAVASFLSAIEESVDIPGATQVLTASLQPALNASFADLTVPDLTPQVVESIEGWNAAEIAIAVEAALTANVVVDFTTEGEEARATFLAGLTAIKGGEAGELRTSIVSVLDTAIQRDSPPKLFLDIGKESGDAFWSGFDQADLTLRTPAVPITGSIATVAGSAAGGGVNVNLNINNPSVNDAVSDAARLGQIASSIATTYRSVT